LSFHRCENRIIGRSNRSGVGRVRIVSSYGLSVSFCAPSEPVKISSPQAVANSRRNISNIADGHFGNAAMKNRLSQRLAHGLGRVYKNSVSAPREVTCREPSSISLQEPEDPRHGLGISHRAGCVVRGTWQDFVGRTEREIFRRSVDLIGRMACEHRTQIALRCGSGLMVPQSEPHWTGYGWPGWLYMTSHRAQNRACTDRPRGHGCFLPWYV
jgi:hypothetical protein